MEKKNNPITPTTLRSAKVLFVRSKLFVGKTLPSETRAPMNKPKYPSGTPATSAMTE
jgi:hypothetical protein